jgi:TatD DNase family protein
VGGAVTYERAKKTRKTFSVLPLESIVLETDAPDMPLSGFQGQPNHPRQLLAIAESLALLRGESLDAICRQTTYNSRLLFGLGSS